MRNQSENTDFPNQIFDSAHEGENGVDQSRVVHKQHQENT